jgi:hypothetical protein
MAQFKDNGNLDKDEISGNTYGVLRKNYPSQKLYKV